MEVPGDDLKQGSPEWHEARRGRITGTRFAAAMAAPHTQRYRDLVSTLVEERRGGRGPKFPVTRAMEWGMFWEGEARRWYARQHRRQVREVGFVVHVDPTYDFVGVSPDGLVGRSGLLEIKCPQEETHRNYCRQGGLPSSYRWQVQGQLWVTGRKWLDFLSFRPPDNGFLVRVVPDELAQRRLALRCIEVELEVRRRLHEAGGSALR